jgi:hypothetical protein
MRTLNGICVAITALALAVVCLLFPSPSNALIAAALLITLGVLAALTTEHLIAYALMAVAALTAYGAGTAAGARMWLDRGPAAMVGLLGAAAALALLWRVKSRLRRVYPHELLIMSSRFEPKTRVVAGPAHVLPLAEKILAEMPRYRQERELSVRRVNTRQQPGPLGQLTQNIDRVEVELVYKLDEENLFRAFAIHNRDAIFAAAAQAVGKGYPAAMRDKQFWIEAWRQGLEDVAERAVRGAIHRSGLTALEVSELREQIGAAVLEDVRREAAEFGLTVLECNLLQVEPDEAEAALAGREALLQALARVEEIRLTGEAQAVARAAQVRAMVDAVKAAGGQVPQRIVELIVHGVLPHTVLSAYLPAHAPGDALVDLHPRGGRPGDPQRN